MGPLTNIGNVGNVGNSTAAAAATADIRLRIHPLQPLVLILKTDLHRLEISKSKLQGCSGR